MIEHLVKTEERRMFTVAVCTSILGGGIGASANESGKGILTEMFAPVGLVIILWGIATVIHKSLERSYDE